MHTNDTTSAASATPAAAVVLCAEATIPIIPRQGGSASIPGVVSVTAPGDTFIDASHSVNAVIAFASTVSIAAPLMGAASALYYISAFSTNMVTVTIKENTQPTKPFSVTLFTGSGNPWTNNTKLTAADQLSVMFLNNWDPTAGGVGGRFTTEVLLDVARATAADAASTTVALPAHAFRRVLSGTKVQYVASVMLAASRNPRASARRRSLLAEQVIESGSMAPSIGIPSRGAAGLNPEAAAVAAGDQAAPAAAGSAPANPTSAVAAETTSPCLGLPLVPPFGAGVVLVTLDPFGETVVASNSSTGFDAQYLPGPELVATSLLIYMLLTLVG
jgi:hypothetical protein